MTAVLFIRILWPHVNVCNNSNSSMAHRLLQLCLLTVVYVAAAAAAAAAVVAVILVAIFLGKYQIRLFLPALYRISVSNIFFH
jgi:hypothetical protein